MFGSQALETAIGLALMFFIFATAASAITEIYASAVNKRASDLENALRDMFNSGTLPAGVAAVTSAEVETFIKSATGRAHSSYLSAKAFADTVTDLVSKGQYLAAVAGKFDDLSREARGRLDTVKAGLETWFDQSMAAAQDKYRKWASFFLFFTGLALAVVMNASVVNVGQDLWQDSAAREAVVDAASSAEEVTTDCDTKGTVVEQAQCDVGAISAFQLPLGWGENQRAGWTGDTKTAIWWWLTHIFGWLLTAALLMLGAPFWFDLLGKLVNLRAGGPRPKPAPDDDSSYSTKVVKTPPPAPDHSQLVPNSEQVVANLITARQVPNLTYKAFDLMDPTQRIDLYRNAAASIYDPPAATQAQNVDWLATALNLGVPIQVIRDSAAAAEAAEQAVAADAERQE